MGDRMPAAHPWEFAGRDWLGSEPDLLVLTDGRRHGRYALQLPFRDATVMEPASDEIPDISGKYDALVIDRSRLDLGWLADAVRAAVPALRPDSPVIVVLGSGGGRPALTPPGPVPEAGGLGGLRWWGLGMVNGQPCAALRVADDPDQPPTSVADLLVTADLAVRLAAGGNRASGQVGSGPARDAPARHLEDRRQSEHALLRRLAETVSELDRERKRRGRPATPVRDLLRRSRIGRGVLRAIRPARRLADRLRRVAGTSQPGSSATIRPSTSRMLRRRRG